VGEIISECLGDFIGIRTLSMAATYRNRLGVEAAYRGRPASRDNYLVR